MNTLIKSIFVLLAFFSLTNSYAQNPIMKGYADPAMKVHEGKMYMVIGKDKSVETKWYNMPYWTIISSTDLRDWKVETHINPEDTYMGKVPRCWAADLAFKDGKVYMYFSNGGSDTGVVVADKPQGPFKDVNKKALLPNDMSENFEYDPSIFIDDDGRKYLIYGRDGFHKGILHHYQLIELNDDMMSLKGAPKNLMTEAKYGFGGPKQLQDHQYFHKYGDTYYLSCSGDYRTSKNIEGPYTNPRNTGQPHGHSSFSSYNGQSYHAWENSTEPYGKRTYRQVMMTYLHYKDNGDMISDKNFISKGKYYETGVGSYVADWDKIEAEWFFKKSIGITKKEGQDGFVLKNIKNNDYVNFPSVIKMKKNATINFELASKAKNGTIEIRLNSAKGELLGSCEIPCTKSWKKYQTVSTTLKNKAGLNNLYFVFKGNNGELVHLDYFSFNK